MYVKTVLDPSPDFGLRTVLFCAPQTYNMQHLSGPTSTVAADTDVQVIEDSLPYYRTVSAGCFMCSLLTGTLGTLSGWLCLDHCLRNSERKGFSDPKGFRDTPTTLLWQPMVCCIQIG